MARKKRKTFHFKQLPGLSYVATRISRAENFIMNSIFCARFNDNDFECGLCERGKQPDGDMSILVEVHRLGQLQAAWRLAESRLPEIAYNLWVLALGHSEDERPLMDEGDILF